MELKTRKLYLQLTFVMTEGKLDTNHCTHQERRNNGLFFSEFGKYKYFKYHKSVSYLKLIIIRHTFIQLKSKPFFFIWLIMRKHCRIEYLFT